jgi:hypothetical protein
MEINDLPDPIETHIEAVVCGDVSKAVDGTPAESRSRSQWNSLPLNLFCNG